MLPGFRFLFAAIMLLLSILIFGLGAAALLRAAHEEVASNPSWRATPETTFAQQPEATRREAARPDADAARPVLAMLRVDAPVVEKSSDVPAAAAPLAPAEQAAPLSTLAEPEGIAALKPEDSSLPEPAKPEIPVSESPAKSEAAPALANAPAPADEIRIAAATTEAVPPANEAARAASGQTSAAASPDPDLASTKIATLNGPPVTIGVQPPGKAAGAKPDTGAIQKRLQARRAAQRRRMAARARLARQALLQQQQIPNPFAPPAIQPAIQPTVQPSAR